MVLGSMLNGACVKDMVACTALVASCLMVRPSWLLTITAGSVAVPTAMVMAAGREASVYTSAAMAPACCALFNLS